MAEFRRNRGRQTYGAKRVKVMASKVAAVRRETNELFELAKLIPEALAGELKDKEKQIELFPAHEVGLSELALPNDFVRLMARRTIAQRMMVAALPKLVYNALRKAEDHLFPGDTRLIVEMLKGSGILEPSLPMTDDEREAKMKKHADFEKKSVEELKAMVLAGRAA